MEVANWASPPTEVIEWIGEDSNWPPTDDPIASLLPKQRSGHCSPWSARVSDRLVGFGAFSVRHDGQVADLSHLLVKRHRHAVAIAVEVVHQLAALDGRDSSYDHLITPCQELFVRQRPSQRMVSATSLRPNSRWSGRDGRSRQVPQPASCFVTKLAVPGRTDLVSAGAGRTRCHSREGWWRLLTEGGQRDGGGLRTTRG